MRILITGPGGFLGSALAKYWALCGHQLWLLARKSSRLERLPNLPLCAHVVRAETDVEIAASVRDVMPDIIVHTACSYGRKGEPPLNVLDSNVRLGSVLLQAILDNKKQPSAKSTLFMNTGTVLDADVSLYALSKTLFSQWGSAVALGSPQQLQFIDIRLQQMYGPGDDESKFTTYIIETCRKNQPKLALTKGEQLRDFIHVNDVVRAYDCILGQRDQFAASDTIDVGSGNAVTMRSFVELAKQIAGAETVLDFGSVAYRANEAMLCVADTKRLSALGWRPSISLAEGLMKLMLTPR